MNLVMVLTDFLIPALMLLFGLVFWKAPSDKVDKWYGYRTKRALKSREAYVFAQVRMGRIWTEAAIPMAVLTLVCVLLLRESGDFPLISLGVMGVQAGVMLLCMIPVELALKKKFDRG